VGVKLEARDTGADALFRRLGDLGQAVTVGVHADAQPYADGTDVVTVAASQEFGTPAIPRRSFLRGFADSGGKKTIADAAQAQLGKIVDGADPETLGEKIGDAAVEGVLDFMSKGIRGVSHPGYTGETAGTVSDLERSGHLRSQIKSKAVDP